MQEHALKALLLDAFRQHGRLEATIGHTLVLRGRVVLSKQRLQLYPVLDHASWQAASQEARDALAVAAWGERLRTPARLTEPLPWTES